MILNTDIRQHEHEAMNRRMDVEGQQASY